MVERNEPIVGKGISPPVPAVRRPCKDLEKMRQNPRGDWCASDVERVCKQVGMNFAKPTRGSHFKTSSEFLEGALTIPARKPIKAPYIRDFVTQVDAHQRCKHAEAKTGGTHEKS